jgi:ubiquinone/menaquinone biosynthesis C-methylase UbiE
MKTDVEKWIEKDGEDFLKAVGIKEGQVVLDFGCGEGHYAVPAAKLVGEKGIVYAVDKDKQALDRLTQIIKKNNIKNVEVIKKESIIPLENNSLDFILCYDVVHYLKNRQTIYHEFYRVLRPEGIFSLYPKHHKNDYPLMELAQMKLEDVIEEVEDAGFSLHDKFFKSLIHDDNYNDGYILNFGKNSFRVKKYSRSTPNR